MISNIDGKLLDYERLAGVGCIWGCEKSTEQRPISGDLEMSGARDVEVDKRSRRYAISHSCRSYLNDRSAEEIQN